VLKFATAEILSADLHRDPQHYYLRGESQWVSQPGVPDGVRFPASHRIAHRHEFQYTPKHGMLYVRSRMISSRCNDNYDEFPAEEIKKGYRTFVGKPVFVNHHNDDHRRMRGLIIDAALHEDRNPDGTPDTWVEGLMEIDALRYPKLAQAIIAGHIERTSMGVDVKYSVCSACGNKATTPMDYCHHVPGMKGKTHYRVTGSGTRVGSLIRETCFGLNFFENSLLVEPPADPTAYTLGRPVLGPGLEHLARTASRVEPKTASYPEGWPPAQKAVVPVDPRSLVPREPVGRTASLKLVQATQCLACRCRDTIADTQGNAECFGCGNTWHEAHKEAALRAEAAKYDKVEDHPWFQANPVHHDNIVKMWNQATDDEKESGKRWYEDAHHITKAVSTLYKGKHPQGAVHAAAGLMAVYSPQTAWTANLHNATRAIVEGKGIGGKGGGIMASASQKESADKILKGANYNDVLKGPKVRDFAHLIEHGGDEDPTVPHVVVDRHALSVAAGKRLSDADYSGAPLSGTKRKDGSINRRNYDHVVSHYHEAARRISEQEGEHIAGHQVQAVTWLAQQRANQKAERDRAASGEDSRLDRGRENSRKKSEDAWKSFRDQHLPGMKYREPGTGYQASKLAYGETKAPADVDTLRDENCPVCGEADAWDGNVCPVCSFVAPPKQFQDPNLDLAKQLNLRQQQNAYDNSIVPNPDAEGMLGDEQPDLICNNCGTEFPAAEPTTIDTEDPQAGADPMESEDPETQEEGLEGGGAASEGDVCPACGKGVLVSGDELEAARAGGFPPSEDIDEAEPGEDEDGDGVPDDEEAPEEDGEEPGPVDPRELADVDPDEDDESDEDEDDEPAKGKKFPPKK